MLLVAAILCGCASSPPWPRQTFAFALPSDPPATSSNTNLVSLHCLSISPLFQSRAFTYRTAENSYVKDPYAGFLIAPEQALTESIRAWMRASNAFGSVVEPGSGLTPTLVAEMSINQIYGDFRKASQPVGTMEVRFVLYEVKEGGPRRIVLDKVCARETPLARKTPDALMAAWNTDLREIMEDLQAEYAKANQRK